MSRPLYSRREVREFSQLMEKKLRRSENKGRYGRDDYKVSKTGDLLEQLDRHIDKARIGGTKEAWADVANYAMMMAYHCESDPGD
jgi:hypothetical protein